MPFLQNTLYAIPCLGTVFFITVLLAVSPDAIGQHTDQTVEKVSNDEPQLTNVMVTLPVRHRQADTLWSSDQLYGDELRRTVSSTLGESLSTLSGIANSSFGPSVGRPVVRGQSGGRVLVLQNSLPTSDASAFSADHGVNVDPLLADSIEILRGPSTLLYGGGAIGGVINVLDGRIPSSERSESLFALESRFSSVDDGKSAVFRFDDSARGWAWHLDAGHRVNNNVEVPDEAVDDDEPEEIENSFGSARSITAGLSRIGEFGYIGASIQTLRQRYGVPPEGHAHEGEEEEEHGDVRLELKQYRYDMRAELAPTLNWLESLRWYSRLNDYEHQEFEGSEIGTKWLRQGHDHRLEAVQHLTEAWHSVVGLQFSRDTLRVIGDEAFLPPAGQSDFGLFWLQDYEQDVWHIELGLRFDRARRKQKSDASRQLYEELSASLASKIDLSSSWQLGLAMSRSARAPGIEELYSNDGEILGDFVEHVATEAIEVGDKHLQSEVSNNVDFSVRYQVDKLSLLSSIYHNQFDDYITLSSTGLEQDELPVRQYVQTNADFTGIEIDAEYRLTESVALSVFGDKVRGSLGHLGAVPRMPPKRIGVELSTQTDSWFAELRYTDVSAQKRPGTDESTTDGYERWDASVEWVAPTDVELKLFAHFRNISDEEIRNATSFLREIASEPGQSVELGFRLTL